MISSGIESDYITTIKTEVIIDPAQVTAWPKIM